MTASSRQITRPMIDGDYNIIIIYLLYYMFFFYSSWPSLCVGTL